MSSRLDTRLVARRLVDPQDPRMRALYRPRTTRAVLALGRCWIIIAAALALAAWKPGLLTFAVAFVIVGTQQYALSILSPPVSSPADRVARKPPDTGRDARPPRLLSSAGHGCSATRRSFGWRRAAQ
ncbi:MAG TPA: hypothetical protein VMT00_12160 [Thermoanaerobaculia bacterium]|nr:hypothetical protein [Thermoanaerobaculia bacterium]